MACVSPLSRSSPLKRPRSTYEAAIMPSLLQQESYHAASKRPRIRFASEADLKIQAVFSSVEEARSRVSSIKKVFDSLELKVDLLEIERESQQKHHPIHQLSFPLSPLKGQNIQNQVLNSRTPLRTRNSLKLHEIESPAALMTMSPRVLDYLRKRRLVENYLNRTYSKVKVEEEGLEELFQDNFSILKFKRAEDCLLDLIRLQRKVKGLQDNYYQLRDRLFNITEEYSV